jgi:hypothetical protein
MEGMEENFSEQGPRGWKGKKTCRKEPLASTGGKRPEGHNRKATKRKGRKITRREGHGETEERRRQ